MHTVLVIVGGLALFGIFLLFGKLWGDTTPALVVAAQVFIPVWLLVCIANMWIGVSKAGYTVRDEAPVLLIVFIVPAIIAAVAIWRLRA